MENTTQTQFESAVIWIDKLKTTRRKQGREMLGNSNTGYCCLGIACKVLNIEYEYNDSTSAVLMDEIGLVSDDGEFTSEYGIFTTLTTLNDKDKLSFKKIVKRMKSADFLMFKDEVAELLTKHYA